MYQGTYGTTHGRLDDSGPRENRTVAGLVLTTGILAAIFAAFLVAVAVPGLVAATLLGGAAAEAIRAVASRLNAGSSSGQQGTVVHG
ncbi:MAG: hypothetical protein V5A55_06470 [Halovenus sp.]